MKKQLKVFAGSACLALAVVPAMATDVFPTKPIRIVVAAGAGGDLDITTRIVAEKMGEMLGQTVLVENRPGAETLVGTRYVKQAAADGYTLLANADGFTAGPSLRDNSGYDPLSDFTGVGMMLRAAQVMYIGADKSYSSVSDFTEHARKNPGLVTYAHGGVGTPMHLSGMQFVHKAEVDVVPVPYNGSAAAYPDVASGRVDTIFAGYGGGAAYMQAGKMRPLGVTGDDRMAMLPDVPTMKEQGVDLSYYYWLGLMAPSGTPELALERLSQALKYALESKEVLDNYQAKGAEAQWLTPSQFNEFLAQEVEKTRLTVQALELTNKK